MNRLEGKTALVTGGGTDGIGRAIATRLVSEGAHVFITGRRKAELDKTVEAIGHDVTAVPGDITNPDDLDALYELIAARGQGLDVLCANAAAASFGTIETMTIEDLDRIFDVNVKGTVLTVQKALPILNDGASVILTLTASVDRGLEGLGAYAASKAALRAFVRTWANELRGRGIRVNAVSPAATDTAGVTDLVGEKNIPEYNASLAAQMPIGRVARPDEIAGAVAFLASSDSSFMLGANVFVDGGVNQI